ncbi:YcaQ family DNA glycosylase [Burkholderia cenocepacia]|uniref:winged helix-turn-helix domain-containing protein n=1 Tax=Burkholderia cepacia complex TaxID=87882 RepID=UPI000F564E2E|nr:MULTISPECIES: crosslink repair DNA glycosylase YcaQ family protein [Burkholderia cepacia complex]ELW9448217.1 YcaQ family DNA glycosylase [Burkholderia cenocepacia]MBR8482815.1 YcaQ family DNA glycosylase [Burkholderia cenocepacia]MDN7467749.1 crosslink repair DNA glycosylase YcaQ family protein [Burkholderia orbicola]MDN7504402.1 crosslink repair DNA glycosylase YcaQ family protein [Burkholderia orbicola]RQU20444.1 winged helix-turn-helix domain-containing protein [Burkholderia cenocepacia
MLTLSPASARALHLAAQGLLTPPRRKATKADVLDTIRRMAQLQIDTIHVVARSPYLVLFSRLGDFSPHWLDEHLAEARLFEYWSHEACFLPIEQFGLMRYKMLDPSGMGWKYAAEWHEQNRPEIERLLARIRDEGPVRSADFAREDGVKGNGWWDRKPEKRHLEVLFTTGDLMVSERRNFQRVYDVRERVLPDWDDTRDLPPREAVLPALLDYTCRALGVVRADWVADYYRLPRRSYRAELERLADAGDLIPVQIDDWKEPAYVHRSLDALLPAAAADTLRSTVTTLLSPFDPVVWDRRRASTLFGFDYTIECYTPEHKRRYGYFCLPVLHRGRLVGRVDAKAHRTLGTFELKAVHVEPGVRFGAGLAADVAKAVKKLAAWHGTPEVTVTHAPPTLVEAFTRT